MKTENILVVGDLHLPFELDHYLEFCIQIKNRCKCEKVIMIGDLVDNHAFSFHHDIDPDGLSPKYEIDEAKKRLRSWYSAFPEAFLCLGNHDARVDLKAKHVGLPSEVFRPFRDIWGLPGGWREDFSWEIDGVRFTHGTGLSGDNAHLTAAIRNRQSTVIGHIHHLSTMAYTASEKDCIFGMAVGCGIDRKTYAFEYGRDFTKKPVISCGIVTDKGKYCQVFKMDI